MKKLMTMIAAVATAFGLFAEVTLPSGTSFESLSAGTEVTAEQLNASETGATWAATGSAVATPTEYDAEVRYATRPTQWDGTAQNNYLKLGGAIGKDFLTREIEAQTIDSNLYVDTLVKFTAADGDIDLTNVTNGPKIAVWVKSDEECAEPYTNLMVTAGFYQDGAPIAKTYDCGVLPFEMETWHRLTIKAIKDITANSGIVGFVVFLDGDNALAISCEETKDAFTGLTLTREANVWKEKGCLFPTMNVANQTLSQVAFSGIGGIDDISITAAQPFANAADAQFYEVTAGANVTGFIVKDQAWDGTNPLVFQYDATATDVVASNITYVTGWFGPEMIDTYVADPTEPIVVGDAKQAKLVVDEGGTPKYFETFADALQELAGNDVTIKLAQAYTVGDDETITIDNADHTTTIDLAGLTLTGTVNYKTPLTVMDSSEAGTGKIVPVDGASTDVAAISIVEGIEVEPGLTILSGTYDGSIATVDLPAITGGRFFDNSETEDERVFPYIGMNTWEIEGTTYEASWANDYWTVAEKQITKGTVIFICEKNGAEYSRVTNDTCDVGTVINKADFPTFDLDADVWTLTWTVDSVTVAETETEVTATATIEFTGEGTEAAPYQITSAADFKKVQAAVADGENFAEKFFVLANNVDMSGIAWEGIGQWNGGSTDLAIDFRGTLNGAGYTISNITFARGEYYGFFNQLENATISNITFNVSGFAEGTETSYGAGVIANWVKASTFDHVTVTGTLTGTHNMAGFAIKACGGTTFTDCVNEADLTCDGKKRVGGFVGFESSISGGFSFTRCVNNGDVAVTYYDSADYSVGGFVAGVAQNNITFTDCVNNGDVIVNGYESGTVRWGAFIGVFQPAAGQSVVITATNCSMKKVDGLDAVGGVDTSKGGALTINGFYYATAITDSTVTFSQLAEDGTFTLMKADLEPAFTLEAIGDTITFKTNLFEAASFAGIETSDPATIGLNEVADADGVTFTAVAAGPAPIDPTKPSDPMDEDAAKDAAKAINDNPADYIKVPADFEGKVTGDALTAYTGYFKAVVVPSAEADKFEVVLELNQAGSNKVATAEQTTDAEVLTTVLAATGDSTAVTVPPAAVIPGFYYSLKQGAAVTALGFEADGDANKKGGVDTLTFQLQKPENSGFYQMLVTPKPVDVPVGQ